MYKYMLQKKLSDISIIKNLEKIDAISVKNDIYNKYKDPEARWVEIKERLNKVNAYKFKYLSDDRHVTGFLLEPKVHNSTKVKLPCLIWNRGGNRNTGKIDVLNLFGKYIYPYVENGYMVLITQYSGNKDSEGRDEFGGSDVNDVLNLKIIIDEYEYADENRIGMYGISRGGMMTYLASTKTDWIKSAIINSGLVNHYRNFELRPEMKIVCEEMFDVDDVEEINKRSPLFLADKIAKNTAFLIMHGSSDWRVSVLDSIDVATKLYENRVPYRLIIYEGGAHGLPEYYNEFFEESLNWFNKYVKNLQPLPNLNLHGK